MRTIVMIKIGSSGEQLPADATEHEAVLLPAVGLMFTAKVINAKAMTQPALEEACKKVTCAGFSDWDMAEIDELALVVDRSRYNPALNTEFFKDLPLDWLWSKTPAAWSSSSAWYVNTYNGSVYNYPRDDNGFALAVRRMREFCKHGNATKAALNFLKLASP